jgi:pyruvate/2-oxoglutarate dehydrogenase complex dihydrolipoamide dehydrogenase (E3) component
VPIRFRRSVIAVGARPARLEVPGAADVDALTSDDVFALTELPRRLIVIGGGPIGCELALAMARFGSSVTLVSDGRLLPRDDPDASALVAAALRREGVELVVGARVTAVRGGAEVRVWTHDRELRADRVLVAVGRRAALDGLGLDAAGIRRDEGELILDGWLRTTNPRVFAAGDVAGRWQFTHAADAMARQVVRNALFAGRRRADDLIVPWCTYTDPEVAHVGIEDETAARDRRLTRYRVRLDEIDRAIVDGATDGFVQVYADRRGRIACATVVAPTAGDLIAEVTLAMQAGIRLGTLSETIHPYPTYASALQKVGDAWMRHRYGPLARKLATTWLRAWP